MHHIGTVTKTAKHPTRVFHAQCSCGPAGDFATLGDALNYLQGHFAHLGGISTHELLDKSEEPIPEELPVPAIPISHAPTMPAPDPQPVVTGEPFVDQSFVAPPGETVDQVEADRRAREQAEADQRARENAEFPASTPDPAPAEDVGWRKKKR